MIEICAEEGYLLNMYFYFTFSLLLSISQRLLKKKSLKRGFWGHKKKLMKILGVTQKEENI